MPPSEPIVHLAGALLVAAMLVRSLRTFRVLALAGGAVAVAACLVAGQDGAVLWWACVFTAAAGLQLILLVQRGSAKKMRGEERALLEEILRVEDPAKQRRLVGLLAWRDAAPGEVLIRQGQARPPLIYIAAGTASIELEGQPVGSCGAGDFLGDMSGATGEPASTAVVATEPMRIAQVDREALAEMAAASPEIGAAFDGAINRSLAAKIQRMNATAAVG